MQIADVEFVDVDCAYPHGQHLSCGAINCTTDREQCLGSLLHPPYPYLLHGSERPAIDCNSDRMRYRRNPDHPAPHFIAIRRDQIYCGDDCAAPAKMGAQLKRWNENRGRKPELKRVGMKPEHDPTPSSPIAILLGVVVGSGPILQGSNEKMGFDCSKNLVPFGIGCKPLLLVFFFYA